MKIEKLISSTMANPYKRRNRRQIDRILITFQSYPCFLLFHCVHFPFHFLPFPFRLFYAPPYTLLSIKSTPLSTARQTFFSLSLSLSSLVPDKNIFHSRDTREETIEEGVENCERGMDSVNLRVGRLAGKRIWRGNASWRLRTFLARISFPIRFPTVLLGTFSSDPGGGFIDISLFHYFIPFPFILQRVAAKNRERD